MKVKNIYKPYRFAKKKKKDIDKPKLDLSSDNWRIFMNFPQFYTSNFFSVSYYMYFHYTHGFCT